MPHGSYVILSNPAGNARDLYLKGPIIAEIAEVEAPKITDVATEEDRRVGPSIKQFKGFSKGIGTMFADEGDGLWDARNVWTLEEGRITPRPARILNHLQGTAAWEFNGVLAGHQPILLANNPNDGIDYIFVLAGGALYKITSGGTVTQVVAVGNALVGRSIVEFAEPGATATNRRMYLFFHKFTTPRANYMRSSHNNYLTYAAGARVLCDGIVFDNKLVAADDGGKIVFSTNGLSWNDEDVNDMKPVLDLGLGPITFVGVAQAPWGSPAIYFLHRLRLYVLNFDTRECFPIPLQNTVPLMTGCIWQGKVIVTDYFNVYEYDPETQKSRNIGFTGKTGGRPFSAQAGFRYLFPCGAYLGALACQLSGSTTPYTIFLYNERGWHPVYSDWQDSPANPFGFAAGAVAFSATGWSALTPQIVTLGAPALSSTNGTLNIKSYNLPKYGSPLNKAGDACFTHPTDVYADTPWYRVYGDLSGIAIQVTPQVDIPSNVVVNTLRIYYRISKDDYSDASADFTLLGEVSSTETPYKILPFGAADGDGLFSGIGFRRIQFRVGFYHSSGAGQNFASWPEFYDLSFVFHKYTHRKRFRMTVDVAETINQGTINGIPLVPTYTQNFSEVWQHVVSCITNNLARIDIPNFYSSRVLITGVSGVHSDLLRDDETGGSLEVVAPGEMTITFEEVGAYDTDGFSKKVIPTG